MRRLLILASTMVFFDVAFYAAIAPLLPHYVSEFGLSEAEAGILQASYAAGTLLLALPSGLLAARIGPRSTVIGGLALFGVSGPRVRVRGTRSSSSTSPASPRAAPGR